MDAAKAAALLGRALADAKIPYAIGGALAYAFWGVARATQDVDINLFVEAEKARGALEVLSSAGVKINIDEAIRRGEERGDAIGYLNSIRIDLFFNSIPLHIEAGSRTAQVELHGESIAILSAFDLVLFKMLFFRGKDIVDIERLLAMRDDLDHLEVRRQLVDMVGEDDIRISKWDELTKVD